MSATDPSKRVSKAPRQRPGLLRCSGPDTTDLRSSVWISVHRAWAKQETLGGMSKVKFLLSKDEARDKMCRPRA